MQLFTRRVGERIWIAPDIWITLSEVRNGMGRIGVDAPYGVLVKREEHVTVRDRPSKCPHCGNQATPVDCERRYPVLIGDRIERRFIEQGYYCAACECGVEVEGEA